MNELRPGQTKKKVFLLYIKINPCTDMMPHSLIFPRGEWTAVHRLHKNVVSVKALLVKEHNLKCDWEDVGTPQTFIETFLIFVLKVLFKLLFFKYHH